IAGERKSRIDQLKRGVASRSTSSDRQDSRSHSSRRSSPESDRQGHSRSGSFDSRERVQDRDRHEHDRERERERRDGRQRDWDRDAAKSDWLRSRDRDRIRERDRQREKRRDLDREEERPLPESLERERGVSTSSQAEISKHSETKASKDQAFEATCLDSASQEKERQDKDLGALQGFEDGVEAEKVENIEGGDDETKIDDVQSTESGAGEYEPISDDELDEILAGDAEKRDDQQDEEKMPDPVDVIDVDWSSLMPKQPKEPREPGAALLKFTPAAVMLRVGISKQLAGPQLFTKIKETCQRSLEKPKDAESLFEHEFGALNMAALLRKEERAGLLCNLGPCCKALCFRRDSAIRKQLVKNEKGTTKQTYTNPPVVDNELLRLSLRLFKRKTVQQGSGPDKTEDSKLTQPYVPEMCLS
uniref:Zinc finger CCCH-type containing 13 n=2 Tax=Pseudonaja textilis TaxID=8673 RepID=A0A670ZCT8_PSETE